MHLNGVQAFESRSTNTLQLTINIQVAWSLLQKCLSSCW